MTWPLRIFFSLMCLPLAGATVTGRFELEGSRDAAVRRHKDFSGVVVWLEPLSSNGSAPLQPVANRTARMAQRDKNFIPHILAIQLATSVEFPNFDPIFHNAFSNFDGQLFDVGLYPPGTSRKVAFRRPGIVRVFCNIHPTMSAVIVVVNTPWFTVSSHDGSFEIRGVPRGEYHLRVFHERALAETLAALERRVTVEDSNLNLPIIRISESGYLPVPHKNKYGRDYPAEVDDHRVYPGTKK